MDLPEIPREEYDRLDRLNWSRLKLLERSPAHYKHGYGEDSASLKLGTAVHMAILEPVRFAADYVVFEGAVRRGKAWEEFEKECIRAGKSILNKTEFAKTLAIRDAVHRKASAMKYLQGGKPEVTLTWELGEFKCKGRADYISEAAIVDLKSTQCASPRAFGYSAKKYGYFGQAAWYSDGVALSLRKRLPFVIIAVESSAPYVVTVFRIQDSELEKGREQYLNLLGTLDYCTKANHWGGYTEQDEVDLECPHGQGDEP